MDVTWFLVLSSITLAVVLVVMVIVLLLLPRSHTPRRNVREELKSIKNQIEHEAMEEIAPYKMNSRKPLPEY